MKRSAGPNRAGEPDSAEPVAVTATTKSYEFAAARISRRTSRPALAAAAAIVGLLGLATGVGLLDRGDLRGGVPAGGRATGAAAGGRAPGALASKRARDDVSSRPVIVRCHDLDAGSCNRVVAAALDLMGPDAPVESIDAWRSLLCGDDLDCPARRLAGLRPLGSAVVSLGDDERDGWINVGERPAAPAAGEAAVVAWLIR